MTTPPVTVTAPVRRATTAAEDRNDRSRPEDRTGDFGSAMAQAGLIQVPNTAVPRHPTGDAERHSRTHKAASASNPIAGRVRRSGIDSTTSAQSAAGAPISAQPDANGSTRPGGSDSTQPGSSASTLPGANGSTQPGGSGSTLAGVNGSTPPGAGDAVSPQPGNQGFAPTGPGANVPAPSQAASPVADAKPAAGANPAAPGDPTGGTNPAGSASPGAATDPTAGNGTAAGTDPAATALASAAGGPAAGGPAAGGPAAGVAGSGHHRGRDADAAGSAVALAPPPVAVLAPAGATSGGEFGPGSDGAPTKDQPAGTAPVTDLTGVATAPATTALTDVAASTPAPAPTTAPPAAQLAMHIVPLRQGPDGVHRLTVHLHPDDLGPISVIAEIRGGQVSVQLAGSTESGRAALHAALPELRQELADAGFTNCSLDLRQGTSGGDPELRQPASQGASVPGNPGPPIDPNAPVAPPVDRHRLLDLRV